MIELLTKKIDRAARGVAMALTVDNPQAVLAIVAAELEDLREMAASLAEAEAACGFRPMMEVKNGQTC